MRAIKLISSAMLCVACLPAFAVNSLNCFSDINGYTHCPLADANRRDIRIADVSGGDCNMNNAWGVDPLGIWVADGCSAIFDYTDPVQLTPFESFVEQIIPDFLEASYGPGYYLGAGLPESKKWGRGGYCSMHSCGKWQRHKNIHTNVHTNIHTNVHTNVHTNEKSQIQGQGSDKSQGGSKGHGGNKSQGDSKGQGHGSNKARNQGGGKP